MVELCADGGRVVVSVEAPRLVQVEGEVGRLLGVGVGGAVWWTEVRAAAGVEGALRLAGSVAGRLAVLVGGTTWPGEAAHTDVVVVPDGEGQEGTGHPGVDLVTERAAVVVQDRPVVATTTLLTDVIRTVGESGRELCVVTPPGTRLTLPTSTVLRQMPARWVVSDPRCGYRDGRTGAELRWRDGQFAHVLDDDDGGPRTADAFRPEAGVLEERQLRVSLRTVRPATGDLVLGEALADAWRVLTGAPPAGWGTAEPVNSPWSARQLTELARARARESRPTWLVAVGTPDRPALATVRIAHTRAGVEEHIALSLGYAAGECPPIGALPELAEVLAVRRDLATMVAELRCARADLTVPASYEPPPVPVSLTLGSEAVAGLGAAYVREAPVETAPVALGPAGRPALHFGLGDGTDPSARERLARIDRHLHRARR
ncbi:DUF6177 family protein [Streptomyces sp. NPDC058045]|uniref:DUF6177 family protein n=1 Tax=Streptomyces sp. NPDC058045 TaxID=3346311 RepID=UPI0036E52000